MKDILRARFIVIGRIEQRYARADREWRRAAEAARAMFPAGYRPDTRPIGNPNSRVRRLWEERDRALMALMAAQARLKAAEDRLARQAMAPRLALPRW